MDRQRLRQIAAAPRMAEHGQVLISPVELPEAAEMAAQLLNFETKVLEVRDAGTYIAVLAIRMVSNEDSERYHLRRDGYSQDDDGCCIAVLRLNDGKAENDPFAWSITRGRTMNVAHNYIYEHFDELKTGDVVDVEFILGISDKPKISERMQ